MAFLSGLHKGLADEDGIDAVVAQDLCVVGRLDAAFGNEENILRHQRPQAQLVSRETVKSSRLRLLTPMTRRRWRWPGALRLHRGLDQGR